MFKLFVASCIVAVASAGYIAQPTIVHAAPIHAVHAVHAPVATSYQSSHVVHHSAPLVKTVPVVHAPVVHAVHAPVVHHAVHAPLIKSVPVLHSAPLIHHSAPVIHHAPLVKTVHSVHPAAHSVYLH